MVLSEFQSYSLYLGIVILSYLLPGLDEHISIKCLFKRRFNRIWSTILFVIMLVVLMFRNCGADTLEYESIFVFNRINADFDLGFYGLVGIVRRFTDDIIIWQGIMGFVTLAGIFMAAENLKNYIDRKLFILYASVYLYFFSLNYSRMLMSVGILFFALSFLVIGKYKIFVLLNILAGLIHYSSFAVFPVFLLFYLGRKHKKTLFIIGIIGAIVLRTRPDLLTVFITSEHYSTYFIQNFNDSGGVGSFLIVLPCCLLIYLYGDECDERIITLMYVLILGNIAFGFLGYAISVASRLARFTFIFPCVFIPSYMLQIKKLTNGLHALLLNWLLIIWIMSIYIFFVLPTFDTIGIIPYVSR